MVGPTQNAACGLPLGCGIITSRTSPGVRRMQLDHRPFTDDDAGAVSQFVQSPDELFHFFPGATHPLSSGAIIAEARRCSHATVALRAGVVVGYVHFEEGRPRRFCSIGSLIVDPSHRRQGVAACLIEVMAATAEKQLGVRFVRASCFSHNTPAYQLFHKLGFKPADMVLRRAPDGEMWLLVRMHRRTGC